MMPVQFYIGLAIPAVIAFLSFTALAIGFIQNNKRMDDIRADQKELRAQIQSGFDKLGARIDKLGEDYTRFYGEQRRHDARLDALEREKG